MNQTQTPRASAGSLGALGLIETPEIRHVLELAGSAQVYRSELNDPTKRSNTDKISRTVALWACAEVAPSVRESLSKAGLDWRRLGSLIGLERSDNLLRLKNFEIGIELRRALRLWRHRDLGSVEKPLELNVFGLVWAILSHVMAEPKTGLLPQRLQDLKVDVPKVLSAFDADEAQVRVVEPVEGNAQAEGGEPPLPDAEPAARGERVPTHRDDPARVDELNRRPFAEVVAMRMREIWNGSEQPFSGAGPNRPGQSFAVHLHGPWGSGKTSMLNFLREALKNEEQAGDPWVVVEFNAWRNQRIGPPWWSLIREVYRQSRRQLGARGRWRLRWRWWSWRFRADWLPVLLAGLVLALLVLLLGGFVGLFGPTPEATGQPQWGKRLETALKVLATLLAAGAGATAFGRSLLLGSAKAARSYVELRGDPMGPVARLFEKLARGVGRPLAVFIDDLDRCDGDYVVDLLEGVQTLFRQAKVSYVVAADRDWIRTSFEKRYNDFAGPIAQPGRPLGHLFLEKMFQVSAAVPLLSPDTSRRYWIQLLEGRSQGGRESLEEASQAAEKSGEALLGEAVSQEHIQRVLDEHAGSPEELGLRAAAAKKISTPEARQETEHFLAPLACLLERNPRAMKRLINAYGINQAVSFLEGRKIDPGALARWTILELRWPLLADCLMCHPDLVERIGGEEPPSDSRIPEPLGPLFISPSVWRVVEGAELGGQEAPLTREAIQRIVGIVDFPALGADPAERATGPRETGDSEGPPKERSGRKKA